MKEIKNGKLLVPQDDDDEKSDPPDESQNLDEEADEKSEQPDHSEQHDAMQSEYSEKSFSSSKSGKKSQKSVNWIKSKRITKDETREYFKEIQKKHP